MINNRERLLKKIKNGESDRRMDHYFKAMKEGRLNECVDNLTEITRIGERSERLAREAFLELGCRLLKTTEFDDRVRKVDIWMEDADEWKWRVQVKSSERDIDEEMKFWKKRLKERDDEKLAIRMAKNRWMFVDGSHGSSDEERITSIKKQFGVWKERRRKAYQLKRVR